MTTTNNPAGNPVHVSNEMQAVPPAAIPDLTIGQLLERLRAELAGVETRVSAVVATIAADVKAALGKIEGAAASVAQAAKPPATPAARAAIAGPGMTPPRGKLTPTRGPSGTPFRSRG